MQTDIESRKVSATTDEMYRLDTTNILSGQHPRPDSHRRSWTRFVSRWTSGSGSRRIPKTFDEMRLHSECA